MLVILTAVLALGVTALVLSLVLYFVKSRFKVEEDPRIGQILELLPSANCGGCGLPGCAAFAEACVKSDTMEGLKCSACRRDVMNRIAAIAGHEIELGVEKVAVVRCNGADKCTSCGNCVKACPRGIIEIRNRNKMDRRIYVSCVNKDKGPVARKACDVACIGCGKCVKACQFDAITLADNVAYIDFNKCRLCRKCVDECPQHSIVALNFPPRPSQVAETVEVDAQPVTEQTPVSE